MIQVPAQAHTASNPRSLQKDSLPIIAIRSRNRRGSTSNIANTGFSHLHDLHVFTRFWHDRILSSLPGGSRRWPGFAQSIFVRCKHTTHIRHTKKSNFPFRIVQQWLVQISHCALRAHSSQTFVTCQYEPYMERFHELFVVSVAQGVEAASPDGKRSWGPQTIMVFKSIQRARMFELELRSNCARISSNATTSTLCGFKFIKFLHYSLYLQRKGTLVMERKSVIFQFQNHHPHHNHWNPSHHHCHHPHFDGGSVIVPAAWLKSCISCRVE